MSNEVWSQLKKDDPSHDLIMITSLLIPKIDVVHDKYPPNWSKKGILKLSEASI